MLQALSGSLVAAEEVLKGGSCYIPHWLGGSCLAVPAPDSPPCRYFTVYILFLSTRLGKKSEIPRSLGCIFLLVRGAVHTDVQYLSA